MKAARFLLLILLATSACGGGEQPIAPPVTPPAAVAPAVMQKVEERYFDSWLTGVKSEALQRGISQSVIDDAFADVTGPSDDIIELDHTQPEKTKLFPDYVSGVVTARKVAKARELWQSHRQVLSRIERAYGVPPSIILALWGMESNFGVSQGSHSVIESLTTLAYDGRRSQFFRSELFAALQILQQQHLPASELTGSWAGAMGQTQFMPSSYLAYAVDFDGDGKKDIWRSDDDALASIANYLHQKGWNANFKWGLTAVLPAQAGVDWVSLKGSSRTFAQWGRLGASHADGSRFKRVDLSAHLVMPDDNTDYAVLATSNYDVLMDWNRSVYFATSVGLLADAIENP